MEIRVRSGSVKRTFGTGVTLDCPCLFVKKPWKFHEWTGIPGDEDHKGEIDWNDMWVTDSFMLSADEIDKIYRLCKEEGGTIILELDL